ncbi:hypothetical protein EVAR_28790_1 [Eumeta japonica]|uniref:Uncharacterized protein n=1 Tax=Eumeta variegata TaxID=151549 RepID=A0A4C1VEI1_EUMVA|nr:hypothetical protein EVAR_28790_1 [Eumeta japonica]
MARKKNGMTVTFSTGDHLPEKFWEVSMIWMRDVLRVHLYRVVTYSVVIIHLVVEQPRSYAAATARLSTAKQLIGPTPPLYRAILMRSRFRLLDLGKV